MKISVDSMRRQTSGDREYFTFAVVLAGAEGDESFRIKGWKYFPESGGIGKPAAQYQGKWFPTVNVSEAAYQKVKLLAKAAIDTL